MSDVSDRKEALSLLKVYVQDTVAPTLTPPELDGLLDDPTQPLVKRAVIWAPNTAYQYGMIVMPTARNGHRYRCRIPGVSDNAAQTTVQRVVITVGGAGYTSPPALAFSGGGGSGAAAIAVLDKDGVVVDAILTNAGSGYTSAPAITFSGGAGTGATATASVTGLEPLWPKTQGARVNETVTAANGTTLQWEEYGPDYQNVYNVRLAAYRGWMLKAAKASNKYNVSLGGERYDREQVYRHALEMADKFAPVGFG